MKNPVSDDPKRRLDGSKKEIRVFRGGSAYVVARGTRVSFRGNLQPVYRVAGLGFRVVRNKPKGKK
tara:strand:- start:570 stop:767 length:198 start_codon:yes stop_codon:yes gene_type:complete